MPEYTDAELIAAEKAVNRIAKWRTLFAGWQLGTRAKGDPECDAVVDHRELTILMRVELNAFVGLLVDKGVFTSEEWMMRLGIEADHLEAGYRERFPGISATDAGLTFKLPEAAETMKGWRP